jgi:ABC-2 type transport system ATP-binding protein
VSAVLVDGTTLYAHVAHGASALPALLAALDRAGLAVAQVALSRPSLDDVYLTVTGHAYRSDGDGRGSSDGARPEAAGRARRSSRAPGAGRPEGADRPQAADRPEGDRPQAADRPPGAGRPRA